MESAVRGVVMKPFREPDPVPGATWAMVVEPEVTQIFPRVALPLVMSGIARKGLAPTVEEI